MPPTIPSNLGYKVTTRQTDWMSLVEKAWGSEFRAPDHKIYTFGSRSYDSTDKGTTGIYGVQGDNVLLISGSQYPDMRDGLLQGFGPTPAGAYDNGYGDYPEISASPL